MLYYEICSSKISVCTSESECGSASNVLNEHQVKKGLHSFDCCSPPQHRPSLRQENTPFRTEWYRRKLHHSTVQKMKPSLSGRHCGRVHHLRWQLSSVVSNDKHWSVGSNDSTDHIIVLPSTDKLWVHFLLLRSVQMGPIRWYYSSYNINYNIAQSTSKAIQLKIMNTSGFTSLMSLIMKEGKWPVTKLHITGIMMWKKHENLGKILKTNEFWGSKVNHQASIHP